jgi:tRNA nucleotidyltransferase (CCA-adding enzyme)
MKLTNAQIKYFDDSILKLPVDDRKEIHRQVDFLISRLEAKITNDSSFKIKGFKKTGSLAKGTILRAKGDEPVDADLAVYLDVSEAEKSDIDLLHQIIVKLARSVYPQKQRSDFAVQPRTLGIHFRDSGLDVDLVPIIPIAKAPGFGWQPSSQGAPPVKTSVEGQLAFIRKRRESDPFYRVLVRLAKKWRNYRELDALRSFLIELILAHIQDREGPVYSLEGGIQRFLLYVAQSQLLEPISFPENGGAKPQQKDRVVIVDPVNIENNVAVRLTESERSEIVRAAEESWERISTATCLAGKLETLAAWKSVFGVSFAIED